jgi:hypothetical protein
VDNRKDRISALMERGAERSLSGISRPVIGVPLPPREHASSSCSIDCRLSQDISQDDPEQRARTAVALYAKVARAKIVRTD